MKAGRFFQIALTGSDFTSGMGSRVEIEIECATKIRIKRSSIEPKVVPRSELKAGQFGEQNGGQNEERDSDQDHD
ncbi:hypothetical protein EVAR_42410_1 [Eumeta japonica]|uniref:Uncharacterized protein n=1 Tax=Eumeta variegata TaxID=151549 RepID=A0A4C1XB21_EUMVA|nr:hypothetical protein EVAR_42410_1 [Eumeta japonica]